MTIFFFARCCALSLVSAVTVLTPSYAFDLSAFTKAQATTVSTTVETIPLENTVSPTRVLNDGAENMPTAHLRVLDKQINRLEHITVNLNTAFVVFDNVSITLKRCIKDYQQEGQDIAFLDVRELMAHDESATNSISESNVPENKDKSVLPHLFTGWMVNSRPQVATLEHPRYDVALLSCAEE